MILKGSQRGGAKQLGLHLLKTEENEHVELHDILPKIASHLSKARFAAQQEQSRLDERRVAMSANHRAERRKLDSGQKTRAEEEARARSERIRKGLRGLLDRVTGKRAALEKQNQMEAIWALQRDREQRQTIVDAQLKER